MKHYLLLSLILATGYSFLAAQSSSTVTNQEKRMALIIGNGNYSSSVLANPENDARSMAEVLKKLGFKVYHYENLNQGQMKKAIDDFGMNIKGYDVSLFYYAGHGIQAKGYNYIIPVDAQLKTEEQVEYDCVRADRVMALMENSGTKVNIIILDACRNNPFERSWTRAATGRGLAFMNAPGGSLIAYATAPGSTASDGSGKNGLYTSAILESIQTSGLTIIQVFQQVRKIVAQKSGHQQIPWESTSLTGDFFFITPATASNKGIKPVSTTLPSIPASNKSNLEISNSPGPTNPITYNPAMRDFLISAYYMKIPAESFTETNRLVTRNIKSFEEFEKWLALNNKTELQKDSGSEITMYFDRAGIPVKRISYRIGGRDTTFITYTLDSLTSLTSRSRSFNYPGQGRSLTGSDTYRFVLKNDSTMMYYHGLGERKLAEYRFDSIKLDYIKTFEPDDKTIYVYNSEGYMIEEIPGESDTAKTVQYKYLEFDRAGNWTMRYMLNSNGSVILQTRYYNYY